LSAALFPSDFLWGAATSAFQVEGSPLADGAGASIWYRFAHTPGRIEDGTTGDVTCDQYRRYRDDIALMRELGLGAYRFSIAWARVLPEGRGQVNRAGLDHYARVVDALLEHGIQPCVTLYHWDLPAALDDLGGWVNRDSAGWFADYASVVFRALGDRVPMWTTLNEPWVVVDAGYLHGTHAPGHRSPFEAPLAAHNLLRAHGEAVQAYRSVGHQRIGIVVNLEPKEAASDAEADRAAARRDDAAMNRWYLDALFHGRYPQELGEIFGTAWPRFAADDFAVIRAPIDFLGVNYYKRAVVRADPSVFPTGARPVEQPGSIHTALGWEVHAPSLTAVLGWVREHYGDIPLYVTENGAAFYDPPSPLREQVQDPLRVEYLRTHIRAVAEARRRGVDVRGYFVWSFLDNMEWAAGLTKRFGIVHVDFANQTRTPKSSAYFYRDIIRSHGASLDAGAASS